MKEAKELIGLFDVERVDNPLSLWAGDFGNEYVDRCAGSVEHVLALQTLWMEILRHVESPPLLSGGVSIAEIGCNVGLNLRALKALLYSARLTGIEPNAKARERAWEHLSDIREGTAQAIPLEDNSVDLAFTSGVLIHIPPSDLLQACSEIVRISKRYVVAIEYFHPIPVEAPYRGYGNAMFKRDFGAFYLDNFPGMKPIAAGFSWKRLTGLDHLTWWLLEKPQTERVYDIRTDDHVTVTKRTEIVA